MSASLSPLVAEWVAKAEGDYRGALALARLRRDPLPELVCFHTQQSAEKYLKALLQFHGADPPRTHNLVALADQLAALVPAVARVKPECSMLTPYGVEVRYPGIEPTETEARGGIAAIRRIRRFARRELGIGR